MRITNWLKVVLNSLYDGILIADKEGIVIYVNPAYTRITKIKSEDILNKKLIEVRPGSHLTNVIKEGKKELGTHRKVGDIEYMVNMVPIYSKEKIIGGISILNEINDIYNLTEKLNNSKKIIEKLEENVKRLGNGKYYFDDIIAVDKLSLRTKEFAEKIAKNDSNILITGESGTGKELYASAIHNYSNRKDLPFVPVNCASIEKNLMESELFGYEAGAFTGAKKDGKIGLFQLANGGTLFLDEIGDMPLYLQAKILRVIQEKKIERIGSNKSIDLDIKIIAATNVNLEEKIKEQKFRSDLYYRLNVIPFKLLPLRERKEDILPIIEKLIKKYNRISGKNIISIDDEVKQAFLSYDWPGNVRELENVIELMFNISGNSSILNSSLLPENISKKSVSNPPKSSQIIIKNPSDDFENFDIIEKNYILQGLEKFGNTTEGKKIISEKMGIGLTTLYRKLKRFGIE